MSDKSTGKTSIKVPTGMILALHQLQLALNDLLTTGNAELALHSVVASMNMLNPFIEEWAAANLRARGIIPNTLEITKEIQKFQQRRLKKFLERGTGNNEGPGGKK